MLQPLDAFIEATLVEKDDDDTYYYEEFAFYDYIRETPSDRTKESEAVEQFKLNKLIGEKLISKNEPTATIQAGDNQTPI